MADFNTEFFNVLAKVLLRSWFFGVLLLLLWFGIYMLAGDLVYRLNGGMFGLSKHELDVIFYSGMVLTKLLIYLFFLFPWAAIRLVLKRG